MKITSLAESMLLELVKALKDGEFYDDANKETCYFLSEKSLLLVKASVLAKQIEVANSRPTVKDETDLVIEIFGSLE
jgi:hypothetical protein